MIPEQAVLTVQGERFVFVVGDKNVIERRKVDLGQLLDGLREIKVGLKADDRVIARGFEKLRGYGRHAAGVSGLNFKRGEPGASATGGAVLRSLTLPARLSRFTKRHVLIMPPEAHAPAEAHGALRSGAQFIAVDVELLRTSPSSTVSM